MQQRASVMVASLDLTAMTELHGGRHVAIPGKWLLPDFTLSAMSCMLQCHHLQGMVTQAMSTEVHSY